LSQEEVHSLFRVSQRWSGVYPDAVVAVLIARGVTNVRQHPSIEQRKRVIEADVRSRFASLDDIQSTATMQAYRAYYKRFQQTYHLIQQLATVAIKQRPLPTVSALVDVMFLAEMRNHLLTAGHDLASIAPPILVDVGTGQETYTGLDQKQKTVKTGDMYVTDSQGVLSSIIRGPDARTIITPETTAAVFVVYAPEGVQRDSVLAHLRDIREGLLLFSPRAKVEPARLLSRRGIDEIAL